MNNNKEQVKYRAYKFSIAIIKFSLTFPNQRIYWIIADQLVRSATSVGANIIEAQAGSSKKDFIKFFDIALKSANETKYWLGLLRDATEVDKQQINPLLQEVKEIASILGASLLTLKNKKTTSHQL
jgi:four helix bundle protein